jgi:hypothetical protein
MIRAALCLLLILGGTIPAAAQAPGAPFAFVVPVSVSNLHKNLTLLRVRCWVLPGGDWKAQGGALGEGVSGPLDTHLDGALRGFSGDVTVRVPLRDPRLDPAAAKSYRCQVELYDSAGRVWGDITSIDRRYPIDKASMAISETGGLLGQ